MVFYRDQPVTQRKPPQIPTIEVTRPSEGLPAAQMEWKRLRPSTSTDNMFDTNSENSGEQQRTIANKPMPEASLTSKRLREPEEGCKSMVGNKKKRMK